MPIIVILHTLCASRDIRISYGYFCAVQNNAEKAELIKCSLVSEMKSGGNYVSICKRTPYFALYFIAFNKNC